MLHLESKLLPDKLRWKAQLDDFFGGFMESALEEVNNREDSANKKEFFYALQRMYPILAEDLLREMS